MTQHSNSPVSGAANSDSPVSRPRRIGQLLMANLKWVLLGAVLMFASTCVELGVDDTPYLCRGQGKCGEAYECLAGPQCYCVCQPAGTSPNQTCADPLCENVQTR